MTDEQPHPPVPPGLTRGQLDIIKRKVDEGADPEGLAGWLTRVNDLGSLTARTIQTAAEDLRDGNGAKWYAAADAAAAKRDVD